MDGEFFYLSGGKIFISFMIQVIFSCYSLLRLF